MRAVWIVLALAACGDNVQPPRLERVARSVPAGTEDVAFDRTDVAVARNEAGTVQRFVGERWRQVSIGDAHATDFGSDNDGTLLVMSTVPRRLYQLADGVMHEVGGLVLANYVSMPVQVPSGNRYVKEIMGEQRSYVLSPGATTWAETPPMFFSRPVRSYDGTLYAAAAGGVQRFEPDGARWFVVPCADLDKPTCTGLLVGAAADRLVLGDIDESMLVVVAGGEHAEVALPAGMVPVRIAAGADLAVILAKQPATTPALEVYWLFALEDDHLVLLDADVSAATRLPVDHAGNVYVVTDALSKVVR